MSKIKEITAQAITVQRKTIDRLIDVSLDWQEKLLLNQQLDEQAQTVTLSELTQLFNTLIKIITPLKKSS